MRLAILCLLVSGLSPSMTQEPASPGIPVIKITKEDSSIKFHLKASVAIDGTIDQWDALCDVPAIELEAAIGSEPERCERKFWRSTEEHV